MAKTENEMTVIEIMASADEKRITELKRLIMILIKASDNAVRLSIKTAESIVRHEK